MNVQRHAFARPSGRPPYAGPRMGFAGPRMRFAPARVDRRLAGHERRPRPDEPVRGPGLILSVGLALLGITAASAILARALI